MQARLKRLDVQLSKVQASATGAPMLGQSGLLPAQPFESHISREVWPAAGAFGDGAVGGGLEAWRMGDGCASGPAKRKTDGIRQGDAKRAKTDKDASRRASSTGLMGDGRLVPSGRMRKVYQQCKEIMDTMMKDISCQAYFNEPVNYIALGANLFFQLGTVVFLVVLAFAVI